MKTDTTIFLSIRNNLYGAKIEQIEGLFVEGHHTPPGGGPTPLKGGSRMKTVTTIFLSIQNNLYAAKLGIFYHVYS